MNPTPKPGRNVNGWYVVSRAGGVLAALLGVLALTGWVTGDTLLASVRPEYVPMAPITALFFLICGTALFLFPDWTRHRRGLRTAEGMMLAVTVASLLLLPLSLLGIRPVVEHLGMSIDQSVNGMAVGHMSPVTAVCFVLIGATFLLVFSRSDAAPLRPLILVLPPLLLLGNLGLLFSYTAGGSVLFGMSLIPPALTTVVAFLAAGISLTASMIRYFGNVNRDVAALIDSISYKVVALIAVLTILLVSISQIAFTTYVDTYRESVGRDLMAVVDLKAHEIQQWRSQLLRHGSYFSGNDRLATSTRRYLENPDGPENYRDIHAWLSQIQAGYGYQDVYLIDTETEAILSLYPRHIDESSLIDRAREVRRQGIPDFLDFHLESTDGRVLLTLLAPITGHSDPPAPPAVLAFQIDPYQFLYPLLMLWPDASSTAETLIIRRDGTDVQFLNVLRFSDSPPLRLRFPLTDADLPAAMAVLGREGIVEGIDYRGEPVFAGIRAIQDSPWFLVARQDASEVYAPLRKQVLLILEMIAALTIAVLGIGATFWQGRSSAHFRQLYRSEQRYRITVESIGEAIMTVDSRGLIQMMNPPAEALTGWIGTQATNRQVAEIFQIIDEATKRSVVPTIDQLVLQAHGDSGNHALLISRSGEEIPISYNATAVRDGDDNVQGTVLVFRDRTRERESTQLLTASRELLAATQAVAHVGGWEYVLTDRKLVWTAETYRIHEVEPDFDVTIENALGFFPGPARDTIETVVGTAVSTGTQYDLELPFVTAKGRHRWVRTAGKPTVRDGKTVRITGTTHDITDRKEAERELEFQSELLTNVGEAVVVRDTEGATIYWNKGAESIFGWTREEAVGRDYAQLLLTDGDRATTVLDPARLRWEGTRSRESLFRRKDGAEVLTLTTETPLLNDDGAPNAIISVSRDITNRKELELRYAGLFNSIWDAILIANTSREIIDCNAAFSDLFGYTFDEINGHQTHYVYSDMEEFEQMGKELRAHMDDRTFKIIIHYKKKDGTVFRGETSASILRDSTGKVLGFIGVVRDVTEREMIEQQLFESQKMESLGQIAGGIAHDFNNVLMAIGGASQVLNSMDQDTTARKLVDTILSSVRRGNAVTDRMLTSMRPAVPKTRAVALGPHLIEFKELTLHTLSRDVHVRLNLPDGEQWVLADPAQLQQVLLTLAINAADAMPEGGAIDVSVRPPSPQEAHVHAAASGKARTCWCLDVSDGGCGMDEATRSRVFEPFFTTKDSTKGTGLGLAIAYRIVGIHDGWIDVVSTPGDGSTFTIGLPAVTATAEMTTVEEPEDTEVLERGAGESILIIDDEDTIRDLLSTVLEDDGFAPVTADTAGKALSILETESAGIRLIMTDIGLPDMNGRDLIIRIRERYPAIPVVAMTGYADPSLEESLLSAGARLVLKKPYSLSEMGKHIREILR